MEYTPKLIKIILLACGSLLLSPGAIANELPRYDVEKLCNHVASGVGSRLGSFVEMKNTCIDRQQEIYDRLKILWPSVPSKTQKHCDGIVKAAGGSYLILEVCIHTEIEKAAHPRQFKY